MILFEMCVLTEKHPNSSWAALWPVDLSVNMHTLLSMSGTLLPGWNSPKIELQERFAIPDIYSLQLAFAVNERARSAILHAAKGDVEMLPLDVDSGDSFYGLHCLRRLALSSHAKYDASGSGGNIRNITYLDVVVAQPSDIPMLFQVEQPKGSPAYSAGTAYFDIFTTAEFMILVQEHDLKGVQFVQMN